MMSVAAVMPALVTSVRPGSRLNDVKLQPSNLKPRRGVSVKFEEAALASCAKAIEYAIVPLTMLVVTSARQPFPEPDWVRQDQSQLQALRRHSAMQDRSETRDGST